jgi:cytochrome c oxidase subunit I
MSVQAMPAGGIKAQPTPVPLTAKDLKTVDRITGINVFVAVLALSIGALFGVFQGLEHAKVIDIYPFLQPVIKTYYQGLTLHGALNAIVWTTFFICGFFTFAFVRSFNRPLRYPWLSWTGLILMIVGLVMTAIPMLMNNATVLYTFYPPMMADWSFYVGLTLLVIGSWFVGYSFYFTYYAWRKENPNTRTPFLALSITITMVMWQLATLGVAAEILFILLPNALAPVLGYTAPGLDPLLSRTLFWWFGHPLVYFWLLPAYVSWYGMMPAQTNGKMFSEPLARLVFWLFLIFSTPVGFHHQYADPGIPEVWKFIHMLLTMGVGFPSLITAFTVVASLEIGARARGGKGYLRWIGRLNWGDPSYAGQNLAMILFIFGGIGGMINASYNVNMATHNTMWVPGHFHLTVGSAVTLTFFGITYWLVPKLTGHKLFTRWLALAQVWTWFFGMLFFSNAYHTLGLLFSVPRRTMLGQAPYYSEQWNPQMLESVLGLVFLSISATLYFAIMLFTLILPRKLDKPIEMPVAVPVDPTPAPKWLDTWWPWLNGAIALVLISYGPMLFQLITNMTFWSKGMRVW